MSECKCGDVDDEACDNCLIFNLESQNATLRTEVERLQRALRNVFLLTMQRFPYLPGDVSESLLRFCREGGEGPNILRMPVDHDADARFAAEKAANPPFRERKP